MKTREHLAPIWKRVFKSAVWTAGIIVAVVALAYLILLPVASSREKAAEKHWADAGLPIADFIAKCPVQEDSPAAIALDASAAKLGISLKSAPIEMPTLPGTKVKEPAPPKAAVGASGWKTVANMAADYSKVLESPQPTWSAPPEPLALFLSENAAVIQDIREKLHAEVPKWHMDLRKGFAFETPNMLGNLQLVRLLVADCIVARAAGENARALDDLDAAWRLSDGLADRPELISQLIVIAMRKIAVAALRPLDDAPPVWQERLRSWDPQNGLVRSYQAEAAMWTRLPKESEFAAIMGREPSLWDRFTAVLGRPYMRLCLAGAQECQLVALQKIQATGLCASDDAIEQAGTWDDKDIPRWNVIARIALPNLFDAWRRVKYLKVQIELTQKVLEIKAARDAQGAWPVQVPGIEKSFCPQEHWTYAVAPDGTMSIAYSGTPPGEKVVKGFRPPQEYKCKISKEK